MESVIQIAVLFAVIALCIGYISQFIAQDCVLESKKTEQLEIMNPSDASGNNKLVTIDIVQEDFMATDRKCTIVVELFHGIVPKTAENFFQLCRQNRYAGVPFHRIINGFMIQGGDITHQDGTGGESIYGEAFEDENFTLRHDTEGLLSMANSGPHTNTSQFFITLAATPHLDGKHVVFGKVVKGMEHVRNIGTSPVDFNDKPIQDIKIFYSEEGDSDKENLEPTKPNSSVELSTSTTFPTIESSKSFPTVESSTKYTLPTIDSHKSEPMGFSIGASDFEHDQYSPYGNW